MTRPDVSPRQRAAILVAVVGLVAVAVDVAAASELSKAEAPPAGSGPTGAAPTCHAWALATRRANVKAGNGSRDVIIKALAQACSAIPEQLRRAAGEVQGVKDPAERARLLATAASAVLGEGCAVPDPLVDARKVARTCPLPPPRPELPDPLDEEELMQLGAVDYLILNVMERSLIAAGQLDEPAKFLILEFTLSAEILRERSQRREERRHRRSR